VLFPAPYRVNKKRHVIALPDCLREKNYSMAIALRIESHARWPKLQRKWDVPAQSKNKKGPGQFIMGIGFAQAGEVNFPAG
jgi:hypothetical protein